MYKMLLLTHLLNCVHTIKVNKTDNKSVLWIKMIDIRKKLDVKNIHDLVDKNNLTAEQIKKYKIHGSELIDGKKFMYAHEGVIIPVIMHCRTPESCKFKRNLGFKLRNLINCKEQTVLESIKDAFEGEDMQTQYTVIGYRIDLYFHEYKLAIEVDELGHTNRNINNEIERQKALEKELNCIFIRINPDEKDFNIFKEINKIHRHIKKFLIDKI